MARTLMATLALVLLLATSVTAQTGIAGRTLSVGVTPTVPTDSSVRLQGLATSGGTDVLFVDATGNVRRRILGKADLPATVGYTDEAETWLFLQTFTSVATFQSGIRGSASPLLIRNSSNTVSLVSFFDDGINITIPTAVSSTLLVSAHSTLSGGFTAGAASQVNATLGVSQLATLTGGFVAGAPSQVNATLGVTGLTTLARAKTTGIYGVSNPFSIMDTSDAIPLAQYYDAGRAVLTNTGTESTWEYHAAGNPSGQQVWRAGNIGGAYLIQGGNDGATIWTNLFRTSQTAGVPDGWYWGTGMREVSPDRSYQTNMGSLTRRYLTGHFAELWSSILIAQTTVASVGGRMLTGHTTTLADDLTASATTITVEHNQMQVGDIVYLEGNVIEFMAITSAPSGPAPGGVPTGPMGLGEGAIGGVGLGGVSTTGGPQDSVQWSRAQGGGAAAASTITTPAQAHTPGNTLIVLATWSDVEATVTGMTNTAGDTFSQSGASFTDGLNRFAVYCAPDTAGHATDVVTAALDSPSSYRSLVVREYSGITCTQSAGSNGTGSGTGTALATSTITITAASELICAIAVVDGFPATPGPGYSGTNFAVEGDAGAYFFDQCKVVSASEAATATQATSAPWAMRAAAFQAANVAVGPYTYSVQRNLDGTGANAWASGQGVFNTGQVGNGWIDQYSARGMRAGTEIGPTIAFNRRNSLTFNDWSTHAAVGNLRGLYTYGASDVFGVAGGDPANVWFSAEATNGIRFFRGATIPTAHFSLDGNVLLGQQGGGQENVFITPSSVAVRLGITDYVRADSEIGVAVGRRDTPTSHYVLADLAGNVAFKRGETNRMLFSAEDASITVFAPDGVTPRLSVTAQYGLVSGNTAAGHGNIWIDTVGNARWRSGDRDRIVLGAGNGQLTMYDQAGAQGVSIDVANGVVLGGGVGRPYFQARYDALFFCANGGVTCPLSLNGLTGLITSTGNILLSAGGRVTSTGNFTLGNTEGLRFDRWAGTAFSAPRSVSWYSGPNLSGVIGQDVNGAMRVQSMTSGANTGIRLQLGSFNTGGVEPGLFMTWENPGNSITNIVAQAAAGSAGQTTEVRFVPLHGSLDGGVISALGQSGNPWTHVFGGQFYSYTTVGTPVAGVSAAIPVRNAADTGTCHIYTTGGLVTSTSCS